jgi:hypothetical protein
LFHASQPLLSAIAKFSRSLLANKRGWEAWDTTDKRGWEAWDTADKRGWEAWDTIDKRDRENLAVSRLIIPFPKSIPKASQARLIAVRPVFTHGKSHASQPLLSAVPKDSGLLLSGGPHASQPLLSAVSKDSRLLLSGGPHASQPLLLIIMRFTFSNNG